LLILNQGLKLNANVRASLILKAVLLEELGRLDAAKSVRDDAESLPEGN